jgi:pyrophosphatase PpaX
LNSTLPTRFDAILFDFDGTLVDAAELICHSFNETLIANGIPRLADETIRSQIGRPLRDMFAELNSGVSADLLVAEYKNRFSAHSPAGSHLLPGVAEFLEQIPDTVKLGIVTARMATGAVSILRSFALEQYFPVVIGIEDVENSKPDPEPVHLALARLGVAAKRTMLVGDTVFDIEAGKRAGTFAVGITTGSTPRSDLLKAGADRVVESLFELESLLFC